MKKTAFLFAAVLLTATPVLAQTTVNADASVDTHSNSAAIAKDKAANRKDHARLHSHQAAKAMDKATDSPAAQAEDSVKIGADRAAIGEKNVETSIDSSIKNNDND